MAASLIGNGRSTVLHARLIKAQFEPYLTKFTTNIIATLPVPKSKSKLGAQWVVELEDTILFPAGMCFIIK